MPQQLNLFGEPEPQKESKLVIPKNGKAQLSKSQMQFNRLTKRIETLEKSIVQETNKCEDLFAYFNEKIHPIIIKAANKRMELAMVMGNVSYKYKFGKNQLQGIKEVILDLCDKAFEQIEPTPEQEEFYNNWSETTYQEELENREQDTKDDLFGFMNEMFGMDLDPSMDLENEEDLEKLQEKMNEKFNEFEQPEKRKKKTKKQLEREALQKAEEIQKNKSIRSIYITLAKVLHPDTEIDPQQKAQKEELMKQVTVAFEEKDLTTLLKLELEWVHQENEHLEKLTEDKLNIYIGALKQQVAELEEKKYSISRNPRYYAISPVLRYGEKRAKSYLKEDVQNAKNMLQGITACTSDFKKAGQKREIINFVDYYQDLMEEEEMNSFADMLF